MFFQPSKTRVAGPCIVTGLAGFISYGEVYADLLAVLVTTRFIALLYEPQLWLGQQQRFLLSSLRFVASL